MSSYPFDIIKSKIQCVEDRHVPIREVIKTLYAREGAKTFFKGLSPTLLRSFFTNGATMPAFEYINDRFVYKTKATTS